MMRRARATICGVVVAAVVVAAALVAVPRIARSRELAARLERIESLKRQALGAKTILDGDKAIHELSNDPEPEALAALVDLARIGGHVEKSDVARALRQRSGALDERQRRFVEEMSVDRDPLRRFVAFYLLDANGEHWSLGPDDDLDFAAWMLPPSAEVLDGTTAIVVWPPGEPRFRPPSWSLGAPSRFMRATARANGLDVLTHLDEGTGVVFFIAHDPARRVEALSRLDGVVAEMRAALERIKGIDRKALLAARLRAIVKAQREVLAETRRLREREAQ